VTAGIVPDDGSCGDRGPRDAATPARASVGTLSVASDTADSGWAAAWAGVLEVVARELAAASAGAEGWSDAARSRVVDAVDRTTRVLGAAKAPLLVAQEQS